MRDKSQKGRSARHRWYLLIPLVLFLAGFLFLLYPSFSNWQFNVGVKTRKAQFEQQIEEKTSNITDVEGNENSSQSELLFEELYQELSRRNTELYESHQQGLTDPWAYEQQGIDLSEYGLDGNVIGFLTIPKMNLELPILLGASRENMAQGAVHLTETSYPIGGENTNCVIAAHRGYSGAAMFRDIEKLELGDEIYIENFRETLTYKVVEIRIIDPTDIDQVLIQEGRDLVTLITCHPYRHNYQRYVVFCERVLPNS
jgi:LPXTG-site transpeptidase (sortase) family protein